MFSKLLIGTLTAVTTFCLSLPLDKVMNENDSKLILNVKNEYELPRNFRSTQAKYLTNKENVSLAGLIDLNASASGQFSKLGLRKLVDTIKHQNIYILDLREESHVFVNDIAISWYGTNNWSNKDKTIDQIKADEEKKISELKELKKIFLKNKNSNDPIDSFEIENIYTEEDLVKSFSINYKRIPVTDHIKPTHEQVDQFLTFIKTIDTNQSWIHFHCAAGRGRSTTFIALYDMILNAKDVSFEDILKRQFLIGGKDLSEPFDTSDWRYIHGNVRLDFLRHFYQYVKENPNLDLSWSSWVNNRQLL